jgi:hypothetical protein
MILLPFLQPGNILKRQLFISLTIEVKSFLQVLVVFSTDMVSPSLSLPFESLPNLSALFYFDLLTTLFPFSKHLLFSLSYSDVLFLLSRFLAY